ncbi:MAG: hypothetical protein Q4D61_07380 [Cardiobacteriaceae bacterium]|nr:hypothetical protein [Cardiobacteriaceae bacterium]
MTQKTAILALLLAGSVHAQNAAWHQMNRAAQTALQQNIYHHHILPAEQAAAAQRAAQQAAGQGGVRITGYYYYNESGYVAFAIGAEPYSEERHVDGYRLLNSRAVGYGTNAARGERDLAQVRHDALQRCADDVGSACQIIAEAGNSCVAVAHGFAHPAGDDVDRYGVDGELYSRFYVAHLSAAERGNPQVSPDNAQVDQWRQMLAARAHQLCVADRVHPLHQCEPVQDVWAMCGIDSVARGATGVYQ